MRAEKRFKFIFKFFLGREHKAITVTCCLWINDKIITHDYNFVNSFLKLFF